VRVSAKANFVILLSICLFLSHKGSSLGSKTIDLFYVCIVASDLRNFGFALLRPPCANMLIERPSIKIVTANAVKFLFIVLTPLSFGSSFKSICLLLMRIKGSNEFSTSPAVHGWETKYNQFFSPIHSAFDRGFSHLSPPKRG